ncbi:MMPL family transporter [Aquimarina sp. W85]|uniref:MMPL family transporter n=1 Tax=Aquimarina rhodophyticola TaxID=3342246 RepID=UPI00366CCD68
MHKFFISIYHRFTNNKLWAWPILVSLILGVTLLATRIGFEEDITKLLPDSDTSTVTKKVLETVSFSDKIVVTIKSEDKNADALTQFAETYIDSLNAKVSTYIQTIQGKVPENNVMQLYNFVYEHLPFFLDKKDYETIEDLLNQDSIAQRITNNYKALLSPAGIVTKKFIVKDPLSLTPIALKKLTQLQLGDNYMLHNGFLITKDHQNLLLFLTPALAANETGENTFFVERLQELTKHVNAQFAVHKTSAVLFGSTLYAVANAKQIKKDIQLTIGIAMTILLIILIAFYRKLTIPLIIFTPTLFGAILAIAMLYLIKGKISAISLGIGSVLLGITLDYSLHILTHYRNNQNIQALYKDVALPVIMSSLTTAVAFLCLVFVKSEALNDLGVFAAISVIGASIFALIFIPQVYRFSEKSQQRETLLDRFSALRFDRYKPLIICVLLVLIVGIFLFHKVGFDTDLNQMNYRPAELVAAEQNLDRINNNKAKTIYVVSYGNSLNTALNANNALYKVLEANKQEHSILNYSSVGGVVLSKEAQQDKITQWQTFWTPQKRDKLINLLKSEGAIYGFKPSVFNDFETLLSRSIEPILYSRYQEIDQLYLNEFVTHERDFATVMSAIKVADQQTAQLYAALHKVPNTLIIDRKQLNEKLLGSLKNDFNTLIGYSLVAVIGLLLLFYRDPMLVLLTTIPIAITWVITLGIMQLLGINFNIFNVIISTFIFGLGVDYSIFITNGLVKEYTYGSRELPTYKTSILLSVITTILGIGVLIFAKHPALRSISIVSLIGIFTAVIVAFTIQPLLFKLCITRRATNGLPPLQLRQTILSLFSFGYFIAGGFIISILSSLIIPWFPVSKKKKMRVFHRIVSKMMASVLYSNPFIQKKILNSTGETFKKQCIIIANHSSFLDILTVGMLHEDLIYLVKDWVYTSPIFGKAVRLAGFYPVSSGIEGGVEHLRTKVAQGYSLIAFPEGSRTNTAKMSRFHKGSFYLAEQLELDIVPVVLHGATHISPKGDFIISDGKLTAKILPRIRFDDSSFGVGYAQRTKKISSYFKEAFSAVQEEVEGIHYFKRHVLTNYRYKTCFAEVKQVVRAQLKNWYVVAKHIPSNASILIFSDAYGALPIYLSYKKPNASLVGMLATQEAVAIAQGCYAAKRNAIRFINSENTIPSKINVFLLDADTVDQAMIHTIVNDTAITFIFAGKGKTRIAPYLIANFDCILEGPYTIWKRNDT